MNDSTAIVTAPLGDGQSFELAQRQAKAFAASTLVPAAYQNNVPNVLIAMDIAARTGFGIFATMQNLHIINGRPGWSSSFLIATVNASGKFSPLRFRFQGEKGSPDWGCSAVATDKATGEECTGTLVTMAMAKAEGWLDKKGSKWQTMPELMLQYRAAAFWVRVFAPETSLGVHTDDEVADVAPPAVVIRSLDAATEQLKSKPAITPPPPEADARLKQNLPGDKRAELDVVAKQVWGDSWENNLRASCAMTGYSVDKLTDWQAEDMIRVITSKEGE